jgi:hypothetical protein
LRRLPPILTAIAALLIPLAASADPGDFDQGELECGAETQLTGSDWLKRVTKGFRPLVEQELGDHGPFNEIENARVIYWTFVEAGLPEAIAFAAIVNSKSESALDNQARMDDVFTYGNLHYPNGTGAIGLFQLLPSANGAGGPTGPDQGYDSVFQAGRYAGTPWQARHYHTAPDGAGRTYYDATDPVVNTQRIVMEVERDGGKLMEAYERGASIAYLSYIFGRDIERPSVSTWYRQHEAVAMMGPELALTRHPSRLFAAEYPDTHLCEAYTPESSEVNGALGSKEVVVDNTLGSRAQGSIHHAVAAAMFGAFSG